MEICHSELDSAFHTNRRSRNKFGMTKPVIPAGIAGIQRTGMGEGAGFPIKTFGNDAEKWFPEEVQKPVDNAVYPR